MANFSTLTVFPSIIFVPTMRYPVWRTIINESIGGVETPQQPWTYPRWHWEVDVNFLRQNANYLEIQSMFTFYNAQGGRVTPFQYSDPNDNTASSQNVFVGDGVTTSYQLIRNMIGGSSLGSGLSFVEPVFAITTGTSTAPLTIAYNGSSLTSTQYSISNKGILTFSSTVGSLGTATSGSSVSWSGQFNWICRFDKDQFEFSQLTYSSDSQGPLWDIKKLEFTSIKMGA